MREELRTRDHHVSRSVVRSAADPLRTAASLATCRAFRVDHIEKEQDPFGGAVGICTVVAVLVGERSRCVVEERFDLLKAQELRRSLAMSRPLLPKRNSGLELARWTLRSTPTVPALAVARPN